MNKDVIYIEPEDDITDIVTKIENAKEKIVAIVPPKDAEVLHSLMNIELIHKTGFTTDKTIVLVTTDPVIKRLAGKVKMPVTKDLQSAPEIPTIVSDIEAEEGADGEGDAEATEMKIEVTESGADEAAETEEVVEATEEAATEDVAEAGAEENSEKPEKKEEKKAKSGKPEWFKKFGWLIIGGPIVLVALIALLIWAFVIAPAVTIDVAVRTSTGNFSENISFTEKLAEEDSSIGKFYIAEKKLETKQEVEFTATGKKNIGEKASGSVVVYTYFRGSDNITVSSGATFKHNDLSYISTTDATLAWDGENSSVCDNNGQASAIIEGCLISARVNVTAVEPGEKYNIGDGVTNWSTTANVTAYSDSAITGGTDKVVTVVQQSDIDTAMEKIKTSNVAVSREALIESVGDDEFAIESSFKQTVGDPVSKPALGEEVKSDAKPMLTVTTTSSIFVVDKTKVKEFIAEKAKIPEGYKIYEMKDPFIENFVKSEAGYVGKLKTSYVSGPKVTENDITEAAKGKGLGEASKNITSTFDGISEVHITPSFFWVYSVPNDTNKITVNINVKE